MSSNIVLEIIKNKNKEGSKKKYPPRLLTRSKFLKKRLGGEGNELILISKGLVYKLCLIS